MNTFGYTNDRDDFEKVKAWRDAAIKDGWSIKGTYEPHESIERASSLDKDGFHASVITRENVGKWQYEAMVSLWGPDGLAIDAGEDYDWQHINAGLRKCRSCKKEDVDTVRYSFAGRCCKECLPEMRRQYEKHGWCD